MNAAHARMARLASAVLVGGLAAGALLAVAVPTTMKHEVDNWRERIGVRDVRVDPEASLMFEAPPEDLTPASWQSAGQEYPASANHDEQAYVPIDLDANLDAGFVEEATEALPAELLSSDQASDDRALSEASDEAGTSAQAASEAASDVRAVESTALQPQDARTSISKAAERAFVVRDDQSAVQ